MKTHTKEAVGSISCPFAIPMKDVDWSNVKSVVSVDDKANTVIVEMNDQNRFMVEIPGILYSAIWHSGEQNVIDQDLGFNELT